MFTEKTLIGAFAGQQKRMASLEKDLQLIGFNSAYFTQKFDIDTEYFSDFLGTPGDFSELTELYLPEHLKDAIRKDIEALRGLYH